MPKNRYVRWGGILGILIIANLVQLYLSWGLVTVKVHDAPLSEVIKSIEWQGWVKIYTNIAPDAKVTMFVDHVPLSEAMETLAFNVTVPLPPGPPPGAANGAPGGNRRGGRRGGFGAQWNLAFFVAPTMAQAQQEIRAFESGDADDNLMVYSYPTGLQLVSNGETVADPRLQGWPGYKPYVPPAPTVAGASTNASPAPAADTPTPTPFQLYLQSLAEAANIWIMAPNTWTPDVSSPPPPDSSIIRAVKNLVGASHGTVIQALVLRTGSGGNSTRLPGNPDAENDRVRNAINGLPPDKRADALAALDEEIKFRQSVADLPPDQQRIKMRDHFRQKMLEGEWLLRLSPEKRALRYQRIVQEHQAARAH